jgi:hypothetical protein
MDALIADLRAAFLEGADELEAEEPETEEAA